MNTCIFYRGPDDGGVYQDDGVSLGSRRLAIIDLSPKGHMPMYSDNKRYVITYNGEIYNFLEIRKKLQKLGYKFKSEGDTEVILKGYQEWGEKIIPKLNGMFAVAIWDTKEKTLFLARDRVGIKPLYYCLQKNGQLIFSSEIKAILCHKVDKTIDKRALNLYFNLYYIPHPYTIYDSIKKLPPAHTLTWSKKKYQIKKYWYPSIQPVSRSTNEYVKEISTTLSSSVKRQLISDKSVGVFLSGGIDSSLVLAYAVEHSTKPLKTYTVGFDVEKDYDKFNQDLKLARITSDYFSTQHQEVIVSGQDYVNFHEKTTYHLDEPLCNLNQLAILMLSKVAIGDFTVALGGDGGDELFGGYTRYQQLKSIYFLKKLPHFFQGAIPPLLSLYSSNLQQLAQKAKDYSSIQIQKGIMSAGATALLGLRPEFRFPGVVEEYFEPYFNNNTFDPNDFLKADFSTWLPEESLMKSDKLTMANSLEHRVPFLDNEMIDLAFTIPFKDKTSVFETKVLLRRLARQKLPELVVNAPKWGFTSPLAKWLRKDLKTYINDTISSSSAKEIIDYQYLKRLYKKHCDGEYFPHQIWAIIKFICWYNQFKPNV